MHSISSIIVTTTPRYYNYPFVLLQYQQTPLHLSSESGHVDIVNLLLAHGADIHIKNWVNKNSYKLILLCIIICMF